ncbi:hypothetical protein TWF696_007587 [Orbilia brochopaga]|uniref:Uncharacterized protein n=1 Tax=Orbilia brochopaga TaxID=3140254 RepID=A0AAV9UPA7_9PEZI
MLVSGFNNVTTFTFRDFHQNLAWADLPELLDNAVAAMPCLTTLALEWRHAGYGWEWDYFNNPLRPFRRPEKLKYVSIWLEIESNQASFLANKFMNFIRGHLLGEAAQSVSIALCLTTAPEDDERDMERCPFALRINKVEELSLNYDKTQMVLPSIPRSTEPYTYALKFLAIPDTACPLLFGKERMTKAKSPTNL